MGDDAWATCSLWRRAEQSNVGSGKISHALRLEASVPQSKCDEWARGFEAVLLEMHKVGMGLVPPRTSVALRAEQGAGVRGMHRMRTR